METVNLKWQAGLQKAIYQMLVSLPKGVIEKEHIEKTPQRFVESFVEYFAGSYQTAEDALATLFPSKCDEMVTVNDIAFVSFCAHHLVPFLGRVHFSYIPKGRIVGLSKIPRLVEVFSKRPQVQEEFTDQLADAFNRIVKPRGCGVVVEAYHLCVSIRGVKKEDAYTRTNAVRGCYRKNRSVKSEFLSSIPKTFKIGL